MTNSGGVGDDETDAFELPDATGGGQARLTEDECEEWRQLLGKNHGDLTDAELTSKLKLSLKRRLDFPEWVIAFEFTGPDGRRADAIALNTVASRNFKIIGFEFKASRSDWLEEKRDTSKADHFVQLCDEWYVVAGKPGIVKESELPDGWGLFEFKPNSEQLWKLHDSEMTKYQQHGGPDRRFFVKLLKKTVGNESNYTASDLQEARKRGYEDAKDDGLERRVDREIKRLEQDAENWRALEDAGLDFIYRLDDQQVDTLRRAYRLVQAINGEQYDALQRRLEMFDDMVERRAEELQETVEELQTAVGELEVAVEGDDTWEQFADEHAPAETQLSAATDPNAESETTREDAGNDDASEEGV